MNRIKSKKQLNNLKKGYEIGKCFIQNNRKLEYIIKAL